MPDIEFYNDGKGNPTSHEVRVELDLNQGNFNFRGLGKDRKDAAYNAVVACNRFQTQADIEAKTAIALIDDFEDVYDEFEKDMKKDTFKLTEEQERVIDEIGEKLGLTRLEVINNAFAILDWATDQDIVASIDEDEKTYQELQMPVLDN